MDVDESRYGDLQQHREASGRSVLQLDTAQIAAEPLTCKVCERNGDMIGVEGFCADCNEHLCGNCFRTHLGPKPLRGHQLLDKEHMPSKPFKTTENCEAHPEARFECYCRKQDKLLCHLCLGTYHESCQDDELISIAGIHIESSEEFNALYKALREIRERARQKKIQAEKYLGAVHANREEVLHEIDTFKKELHRCVDHLADSVTAEMGVIVERSKEIVNTMGKECAAVECEATDLLTELNIKRNSKSKAPLFMALKTAQNTRVDIASKLQLIDDQKIISKYKFERDQQIQEAMESMKRLGQLLIVNDTALEGDGVLQPASAFDRKIINNANQPKGMLGTETCRVDRAQMKGNEDASLDVEHRDSLVRDLLSLFDNKTQLRDEDKNPSKYAKQREPVDRNPFSRSDDDIKSKSMSTSAERDINSLSACYGSAKPSETNHVLVTAHKVGEIFAKAKTEKGPCIIAGIESLDDDHIVITDWNNSIKLLSTQQKRVIHTLQHEHRPSDVTKVDGTTLAIVFPGVSYIQLISVSADGTLSLGREIQTEAGCWGLQHIICGGDALLVGLEDPNRLQIIDMCGNVLKNFTSNCEERLTFQKPWYIATNKDFSAFYVSDCDTHSVTCIGIDGAVLFTYKDEELKCPQGIAVGDDGVIFISSKLSKTIHMVDGVSGRKLKILLTEADGLKWPNGIMYRSAEKTLFVGFWRNNSVHAFHLTV